MSVSSTSHEHQLDEFGREINCPRQVGEGHSAYAERLVDLTSTLIDAAELRIIELESMLDIASTYGPSDDV